MKKVIVLAIILLSLYSCTRQNTAEKAVKEYLKNNLDDFKSYDPVEFGKLIPNTIRFDDSKIGKPISDKYFEYKRSKQSWEYLKEQGDPEKLFIPGQIDDSLKFYNNKVNEYKPIYDKASKNYKEITDGYVIYHKFRSAQKDGNIEIKSYVFYMDDELKVLKME